ncbi:MAG: LytTR family DNA-binding domain-containing protein [Eubacterium sp.]|nr:LytTR family DNA-binding domain-containing protein [Eubacterium sp.]MCM1302876.1 LytTR family DNA-binding domain-containing protein [Butyrivibrio sp.]MCM1343083.1 LytTR family DNA-binding domain-containing protein [Muribaculaceae bacterium]MCM1410404.1 LytTR family DNA-binding domain-containing protein [Lachnospiraceae bacterium]
MRIAICDDEAEYRHILRERILQHSLAWDYEAEIAEYADGSSLLAAVGEKGADVYFLDIEMAEGSDDGIRTARELRRRGDGGLIVYVTGFIDYVQTGYEVRAFRYLLKSQIDRDLEQILGDIRKELTGDDFFSFRKNKEIRRVRLREVLYLESDRRLIRIKYDRGEETFYGSLDDVAEELAGKGFLRCHKSYLIHMDRVKHFSGEKVTLEDGSVLPISRSYGKEVRKELTLYFTR